MRESTDPFSLYVYICFLIKHPKDEFFVKFWWIKATHWCGTKKSIFSRQTAKIGWNSRRYPNISLLKG